MYNNCFICRNPIEFPNSKPTICKDNSCKIKLENMVVGNYIINKVKNDNDSCLFMLKLTHATASSNRRGHIFNPFPISFMNSQNERDFEKVKQCCQDLLNMWNNIVKLCSIYNDDQSLCNDIGDDNYRLLKFIIMSSICSLTLVYQETNFSIYGVINSEKKEQEFESLQNQKQASQNSNQTKLFFHGSPLENQYSILRNGLKNCSKSKLMINGNISGDGIYLSEDINVSSSYASGYPKVIDVVEVAHNYLKSLNTLVIPNEQIVIIRYVVLINNENANTKNIVNILQNLDS